MNWGYRGAEGARFLGVTTSAVVRNKRNCIPSIKMSNKDVLSSPQAVLDFARVKLAGLPHEAFMIIFLNAKNKVLDYKVLQEGTVDRAVIYPRRMVEEALAHHAAGIILVHNHPSGDSEPSPEDKQLTRSLVETARTIDLRILDHIIVGKEGYCSFLESRLMPMSENSR
jgi:DNA repair protein RadC